MSNFFDTVLEVLKADERFFTADGELMRNAVYEAAMQMDAKLIKALYGNPTTKERFFTDVEGIAVFDKVGFGWVINNREFLPDSYTRYKNKIGLASSRGELISAANDVELVFPYKDCVLEGGQTKEDQKRSEIFYNETLAPDEVDRLLYPKVFTNAVKFFNGVEQPTNVFDQSDNLIIKGNNLLSISSMLKQYENKIKLIYIDPPYNTSGDFNTFIPQVTSPTSQNATTVCLGSTIGQTVTTLLFRKMNGMMHRNYCVCTNGAKRKRKLHH